MNIGGSCPYSGTWNRINAHLMPLITAPNLETGDLTKNVFYKNVHGSGLINMGKRCPNSGTSNCVNVLLMALSTAAESLAALMH